MSCMRVNAPAVRGCARSPAQVGAATLLLTSRPTAACDEAASCAETSPATALIAVRSVSAARVPPASIAGMTLSANMAMASSPLCLRHRDENRASQLSLKRIFDLGQRSGVVDQLGQHPLRIQLIVTASRAVAVFALRRGHHREVGTLGGTNGFATERRPTIRIHRTIVHQ